MNVKCYKKTNGQYVGNFPERGKQYLFTEPNKVETSNFTQTELSTMEEDFFGGNIAGIVENAIIEEKDKVGVKEMEALLLVLDELNEEGE